MEDHPVRVYVGIDWATEEHQVCALDPPGTVLGERVFQNNAMALQELCDWLLALSDGHPDTVWVGIEVPHGVVVETLVERGFVLYSINPKQMDRFRDRFSVAGAKDDRLDALVIADSLRTDTRLYRRIRLDEPVVIELREWSRIGEELTGEQTRLTNRLRHQLMRYYPQALELTPDLDKDWFLVLWSIVPTPAKAQRVQEKTVARLLRSHRIRKLDAATVLDTLRQPAVTVAPGTTEACVAHIQLLAEQLRLINRQIKECHKRLDALCDALSDADEGDQDEPGVGSGQRDVEILRSLPGVGRIVLAALLAEASQAIEERDYHTLRTVSGVAPVTRNSGKRKGNRSIVIMRRACNKRLRDAMYHWSRVAIQHDPKSRAQYAALRKKGHRHGRALRGVGDRLLNMTCAMLRDGTMYDPARRIVVTKKQVA